MTDFAAGPGGSKRLSWIALLGFALALLAVALLVAGAFGYRLGLWDFRFSLLTLTKAATYIAAAGAAISLIGLGRSLPGGGRRGLVLSVVGVIVGGVCFHTIYQQWFTVKTVPFIHDITTDMDDPPAFVAVLPARAAENANPHDYAGPELAAKQRYGYPDLGPLMVTADQGAAFDNALSVAEGMGWEIVAADRAAGRIEATETSRWYQFKDDIVIRVSADASGSGSRIDMRSLSRQGRSDVGVNAARIGRYMAALNAVLK